MSADLEDSGPSLAQRVAHLEAIVDRLMNPVILPAAPMTDEQAARFREEFKAAVNRREPLRPLSPLPASVLDADTVRQLLRESVTVVKPGETLVLQVPMKTNPQVVRQLQDWMDYEQQEGRPFPVLVVPGDGLGIADAEAEGCRE